jgi:hypothetical protein
MHLNDAYKDVISRQGQKISLYRDIVLGNSLKQNRVARPLPCYCLEYIGIL